MPIEYAGGGVLAEHTAVREAVGLFDVSHLGTATVRGPGAAAFVDTCLTNDLARIGPGQAQYTLCCDEERRRRRRPDRLPARPRPRAAGAERRERAPRCCAGWPTPPRPGSTVTDRHAEVAVLAVQGPRSLQVLELLGLPGELPTCPSYRHRRARRARSPSAAPATPASTATSCWSRPGRPGSSGTRCSRPGRTSASGPAASGPATRCAPRWATRCTGTSCRWTSPRSRRASGWAVGWKKPAFWGRDALLAEKEAGPARLLWGLRATGRGIPRPRHGGAGRRRRPGRRGHQRHVLADPAHRASRLALLDTAAGVGEGAELTVDVRGRPQPVEVVRPPFVPSHVR